MNNQIFYFLHNSAFKSSLFDSIVRFFAEPFIYIFILLAVVFILRHYCIYTLKDVMYVLKSKKIEIAYIPVSAFVGWCAAAFLKIIIHADRPFIALSNITTLFSETGYAFPSGHSTTVFALAFAVYWTNKRTGGYFLLGALCVGISRIIAGVHFPIDILGGFLLGALIALVLSLIFKVKKV